jgi:carbamate kinase
VRALIALGGNAMTGPGGRATAQDQDVAVGAAMEHVADLIAAGVDVVLTHGNGPQVGNLLVKNELAAAVVPPVPLDWCGAQTQGTIGFLIMDALDRALAQRGVDRLVATLVTRTRVDGADPGFANPTKPVGRYLPAEEAALLVEHGQVWQDRGARGWRRLVASPEPLEILDARAIGTLSKAGYVVVGAGGGGIPIVRDDDGTLRGVEAVIDKDLAAALLARSLDVDVDVLVIATDVDHAILDYGTDRARPIGRVTTSEMRAHAADGQFASGSMGPKVEAAVRFVEHGGTRSVITSLDRIGDAVNDTGSATPAGTVIENP